MILVRRHWKRQPCTATTEPLLRSSREEQMYCITMHIPGGRGVLQTSFGGMDKRRNCSVFSSMHTVYALRDHGDRGATSSIRPRSVHVSVRFSYLPKRARRRLPRTKTSYKYAIRKRACGAYRRSWYSSSTTLYFFHHSSLPSINGTTAVAVAIAYERECGNDNNCLSIQSLFTVSSPQNVTILHLHVHLHRPTTATVTTMLTVSPAVAEFFTTWSWAHTAFYALCVALCIGNLYVKLRLVTGRLASVTERIESGNFLLLPKSVGPFFAWSERWLQYYTGWLIFAFIAIPAVDVYLLGQTEFLPLGAPVAALLVTTCISTDFDLRRDDGDGDGNAADVVTAA